MNKSTAVKWIFLATAATAAIAFAAGVAYELRSIKKLTIDIDGEEEEPAEDCCCNCTCDASDEPVEA